MIFAIVLIVGSLTPHLAAATDPLDSEPDDRLPRRERELAEGLIQRGMPELVEALLADHPPMHRVYLARAYVQAGVDEKDPATREVLFTRAAEEYRRLVQLGRNPDWLIGERRRFHLAQWRVEFADMILRHWIAPDLDRYEITSGLEFDRDRLRSMLEKARDVYIEAGKLLKDLDVGVRTDEERYLLLGIADRISILTAQWELNSAWAVLYLALIREQSAPERQPLLDEALGAFDRVAGSASEEKRKYNALLGAGIALRESRRFDEAEKAFDRILSSTAPRALAARARYEKARSFILDKHYDDARRELDTLALQPERRFQQQDAGALFYIRLAPLIHAYSYMHEARTKRVPEADRAKLIEKARTELVELAEEGGAWGKIVQVYLDAMAGKKRAPGQLTDSELLIVANERMSDGDYDEAIRIWRILLGRESAMPRHVEARFNLGVCLFQTRALRLAAEAFLSVVKSDPPPAIADRAHAYAYRCWRQLAARDRRREDYLQLAEAARLLVETRPDHPDAVEAEWVAALALEEAGEYRQALAAYARLTPESPNYWQGRRNTARCRQRLYESLAQTATPLRRQRHAGNVVKTWLALEEDL
ncbi:MAG: tetratricopeptide repeat protein, partial [Phycisphaerae bacterium]